MRYIERLKLEAPADPDQLSALQQLLAQHQLSPLWLQHQLGRPSQLWAEHQPLLPQSELLPLDQLWVQQRLLVQQQLLPLGQLLAQQQLLPLNQLLAQDQRLRLDQLLPLERLLPLDQLLRLPWDSLQGVELYYTAPRGHRRTVRASPPTSGLQLAAACAPVLPLTKLHLNDGVKGADLASFALAAWQLQSLEIVQGGEVRHISGSTSSFECLCTLTGEGCSPGCCLGVQSAVLLPPLPPAVHCQCFDASCCCCTPAGLTRLRLEGDWDGDWEPLFSLEQLASLNVRGAWIHNADEGFDRGIVPWRQLSRLSALTEFMASRSARLAAGSQLPELTLLRRLTLGDLEKGGFELLSRQAPELEHLAVDDVDMNFSAANVAPVMPHLVSLGWGRCGFPDGAPGPVEFMAAACFPGLRALALAAGGVRVCYEGLTMLTSLTTSRLLSTHELAQLPAHLPACVALACNVMPWDAHGGLALESVAFCRQLTRLECSSPFFVARIATFWFWDMRASAVQHLRWGWRGVAGSEDDRGRWPGAALRSSDDACADVAAALAGWRCLQSLKLFACHLNDVAVMVRNPTLVEVRVDFVVTTSLSEAEARDELNELQQQYRHKELTIHVGRICNARGKL